MKNLRNINLLRKNKREVTKIQKTGRYLVFVATFCLVFFVISYIFTFSMLSYLSYQSRSAQAQITSLIDAINQKSDVEAVHAAVVTKVSSVEDILSNNPPYPSYLTDIFQLPLSGIIFQSLSVAPSGNTSIQFIASSSADLNEFVQLLLQKDEVENKYKNIRTTGIARGKGGIYNLSVTFGLNSKTFHE